MNAQICDLGISTADGEDVHIEYCKGNLILKFIDWQENPCEIVFDEALAFRWQEFDENQLEFRDDTTYEVKKSEWLTRQAELQGEKSDEFVHYKLCFNTCGTLDVLSRRYSP